MKKMLVLGLAAGLLAIAGAAFAYPTLAGPSGLVSLPNAEVVKSGLFDVAVDYYNTKENTTFVDDLGNTFTVEGKNSWPIRALYGFDNTFEIGAAYDADAIVGKGFWNLNAKWKTPLKFGGWDWALGALYGQSSSVHVLTESSKFTASQVYFAGTGCLPLGEGAPAIYTTVGVNWTQVKFFGDKNDGIRFYLGADAMVAPKINILAEYQTKLNDLDVEAMWGAALRYAITPALSAQVGVSNGPIVGAGKSKFFVGVEYAFGLSGE